MKVVSQPLTIQGSRASQEDRGSLGVPVSTLAKAAERLEGVVPPACFGIMITMSDEADSRHPRERPFRTWSAVGAAGLTTIALTGGFMNGEPPPRVTLAPQAKEWVAQTPDHHHEPVQLEWLRVNRDNIPLASAADPRLRWAS